MELFTRLSTVILIQLNESESKLIFNHLPTCPLVFLSIDYQGGQNLSQETIDYLSSTIEKCSHLRKFEFKKNVN